MRSRAAVGAAVSCLASVLACGAPERGDDAGPSDAGIDSAALPLDSAVSLDSGADAPAEYCPDRDRRFGDDPGATFDRLADTIESLQAISEDGLARLGTSWEAERDRSRRRFLEACSDEDVYLALVSLGNSFHDAHSFLRVDDPALGPSRPAVGVDLDLRAEIEGGEVRYVVTRSEVDGIAPGDLVRGVDGSPIEAIEDARLEWFRMGSSPEGLRDDVARWLTARYPWAEPAPRPGDESTFDVESGDGSAFRATLRWAEAGDADGRCPPFGWPCSFGADDYEGVDPELTGIGYCVYETGEPVLRIVRYRTFYYPAPWEEGDLACLRPRLGELSYALTEDEVRAMQSPIELMRRDEEELLDALRAAGVERVLFDVRENTGGDFDPEFPEHFARKPYGIPTKAFFYAPAFRVDPELIEGADLFLATVDGEPVTDPAGRIIDYLEANPDATFSQRFPFFCATDACTPDEAIYQPADAGSPLEAAILTGPRCMSSCDDFVSIMRTNEIARTAGQPTAAADSPFRYQNRLELADGTALWVIHTVGVSFHPGDPGTTLEAHPAPTDFPVPPTAANRGRMLDAVLAAIEWE